MLNAYCLVALLLCGSIIAWPGMKHSKPKDKHDDPVGPSCTVKAHNFFPNEPCPNMPQPPPPKNTSTTQHTWPSAFVVQWYFTFSIDDDDAPPYYPFPKTPFNFTTGRSYYHEIDADNEIRNMRESYDNYCIPVFGDPTNNMGVRNDYSCDFINVGTTNTAYVILHEDRPVGAPECCIIGKPFHAPPRNFSSQLPVKWRDNYRESLIDWNAVFDKDAGIFNYGFDVKNEVPFAFYMKGVPWIANWMWQKFYDFETVVPSSDVWKLPKACDAATRCPGW
jgi:hypothetical protein